MIRHITSTVIEVSEERPRRVPRLYPDMLGECDSCGTPVPLDGHLYRQKNNEYWCEQCDRLPI